MSVYERNIRKYMKCFEKNNRFFDLGVNLKILLNKVLLHNVYLNYIEVPITTKCTLNCKECANLIQFYQAPYEISADILIKDFETLLGGVKGIRQLRLLGGEPLLYSQLDGLLLFLLRQNKIHDIQIVTNGTLLFDENVLKIMSDNDKVSVDISNYGVKSVKREQLIKQLAENRIKYYACSDVNYWTAESDCRYRNRTINQLKDVFLRCEMDCISLLNGQVHLCPRSSHGLDLKIIPDRREDYVDLRKNSNFKRVKKELFRLLNKSYIEACNYCDIFQWEKLDSVCAGEQISKKDAQMILRGMIEK